MLKVIIAPTLVNVFVAHQALDLNGGLPAVFVPLGGIVMVTVE